MLKWVVGILVAVVVGAAVLWGPSRYIKLHATDPDSFSSRAYERGVENKLLDRCRTFVKQHPRSGADNTPEQYEAMCKCFANDIFERFRNVPPDEFDEVIQKEEATTSAKNIIKKCVNQAGLN